jgi:hypothetical protein
VFGAVQEPLDTRTLLVNGDAEDSVVQKSVHRKNPRQRRGIECEQLEGIGCSESRKEQTTEVGR